MQIAIVSGLEYGNITQEQLHSIKNMGSAR